MHKLFFVLLIVAALNLIALGEEPAPGKLTMPGPRLGIAWGFLYGYKDVPADTFMPDLRAAGGDWSKIYVIWQQIEPQKGQYDFSAVDKFVGQLKSPEEGLISVFAASKWATRVSADILPPSPAKNPDDYYRFIHDLVSHCKGKVRYWQNDSEPNNPIYWSGSADEFVAELKLFYNAVKDADPDAQVIVGGYDGIFNPPGMYEIGDQKKNLAFFDTVLRDGHDYFDVFDMRLYAQVGTIPLRIKYFRDKMQQMGIDKPMVCTEYNGPGLFEFTPNLQLVPMMNEWSSVVSAGGIDQGQLDEKNKGIASLYAKMNTLPPQTQMFMQGCSKELEDKYWRMQCREIVMRNLLAFSAGMQKTMYWDFYHDTSKRDDLMTLMFGRFKMFERSADGKFERKTPVADTFALMAQKLRGMTGVTLVPVAKRPGVYLCKVQRSGAKPLMVVWDQRDAFYGEDQAPVDFEYEWSDSNSATAVDVFGKRVDAKVVDGKVHLPIGLTPIFVEAAQ